MNFSQLGKEAAQKRSELFDGSSVPGAAPAKPPKPLSPNPPLKTPDITPPKPATAPTTQPPPPGRAEAPTNMMSSFMNPATLLSMPGIGNLLQSILGNSPMGLAGLGALQDMSSGTNHMQTLTKGAQMPLTTRVPKTIDEAAYLLAKAATERRLHKQAMNPMLQHSLIGAGIGAGVGGLGSLLGGKSRRGDWLQNAAMGGLLGAGSGALYNMATSGGLPNGGHNLSNNASQADLHEAGLAGRAAAAEGNRNAQVGLENSMSHMNAAKNFTGRILPTATTGAHMLNSDDYRSDFLNNLFSTQGNPYDEAIMKGIRGLHSLHPINIGRQWFNR